jgi:indolepyruvate ferredoxin oxidoreductase, alpha subunit
MSMDPLLESEAGSRRLLLGNDAVSRGALEAGVAVATTYPGTPATEIGDTLFRLSNQTDRYYFEYSTNEKVALEVAAGAAVAGVRALCSMKHVGLNVASDALMTLAYLGVNGGLVLVTSDEPGCHSSQNEQDNRYYARMAHLPLLEPADPQEAKDLTRYGFELSERLQLPVILRLTTRVSHMRGAVTFGSLPQTVNRRADFQRDLARFAYNPRLARMRRKVLITQMQVAADLAEQESDLNFVVGAPASGTIPLGILTSGVGFNYARDAVTELGLESEVAIAKLGFSYPVPDRFLARFLAQVDRCLVLEEVEPLLEQHAKALAYTEGLTVPIEGRGSGRLPADGETTLPLVLQSLAELTGRTLPTPTVATPPLLPVRPPTLCPGCSHRNTFYAAKLVGGDEATYSNDIGCYTLGQLPPLNLCDLLICMGASVNTAGGFFRSTDLPAFAFIGDSTFFHSGMTGLVNAVHNQHRLVLVVMDNRTTGMTGHQPHPGTAVDGMHDPAPAIDIEPLCRAAGVGFVEVVDPADLRRTVDVFERAVAHPSVAVVITRAPCLFVERPAEDHPVYRVDTDKCRYCGLCQDHTGCTETPKQSTLLVRARQRIRGLGIEHVPLRALPEKPPVAPCSQECPAHVCVQSYATLLLAGRYTEAAWSVRERLPMPATVGRVCHRPCEAVCTRNDVDEPVAINALKRYATGYESTEVMAKALASRAARAEARDETVGIIGAGPAGLAAAHDLRLRGFGVTIYEATDRAGGMLSLGIPAYRLPRPVLEREIELILGMGVGLQRSTRVGVDVSFDKLRERHEAVIVAAGAWKGERLRIADGDAEGVLDALTFLKAVNTGTPPRLGDRVLVVGGGDAAIDAARSARRLGAREVTIVYRRGSEEMPASTDEVALAEEESISLRLLTAPLAVEVADGRVSGLRVVRTALGEPDRSGRRRPVPVESSEETLGGDTIIAAIGQRADLGFLPETVERTKWGTVCGDADGASTLEGIFAAGDAVTGPKTVIHAIAGGQRVARAVDVYLARGRWEVPSAPRMHLDDVPADGVSSPPPPPPRYEPERVAPAPREIMTTTDLSDREGADEVELGLELAAALREAERCLVCGQCAKCDICVGTFGCPAFTVDEAGLIAIDPVICIGCGVCAQICPNNAIVPAPPIQLSMTMPRPRDEGEAPDEDEAS